MLESILGVFSIGLALLYLGLILLYIYHWSSVPRTSLPDTFKPSTAITVIIPIRNEEKRIAGLLKSILANNYPTDLLEIIVIDDHSDDKSIEVVKNIVCENIKVISLADFDLPANFNSYKKFGLAQANEIANGELIITTDGDCIVPSRWLEYFAYVFEVEKKSFIAAPVNFISTPLAIVNFQALDFMGMMLITGANIKRTKSLLCNGANLGYSKALFQQVGGYTDISERASGDDVMLMNKVAKQAPKELYFIKNKNATVLTQAAPTWSTFVQQRLRWATKNSNSSDWFLKVELGIVYLLSIAILTLPFFFIIGYSKLTLVWILVVLLKFLADYTLLSSAASFFGRRKLLDHLVVSFFIHVFYIAYIGTLSFFKRRFEWKGRSVQ